MYKAYKEPVFTIEEVITLLEVYKEENKASDEIVNDLIEGFSSYYDYKSEKVILRGMDFLELFHS